MAISATAPAADTAMCILTIAHYFAMICAKLIISHFLLPNALLNLDQMLSIGPDHGGADPALYIAHHLRFMRGIPIRRLYAPKERIGNEKEKFFLLPGDDQYLKARRVAVVDDVINSGDSLCSVAQLVTECGGIVVYAGGIWNRGGKTSADFAQYGILHFRALLDIQLPSWDPNKNECRLCINGVPLDMVFGHGAESLHRNT